MRFGIQSILSLLSTSALLCMFLQTPIVAAFVFWIVLPISIMLIGITAPQNGSVLDVSSRWPLHLLARTWCMTFLVLVVCYIVILTGSMFVPNFEHWVTVAIRAVSGTR